MRMMRSGSGPRRTRMSCMRWPCKGWYGWVTVTHSKDGLSKGVVCCEYAMHEMQSDASTLPARSRPDCGDGGRPQLVWLPATTINRGCDRTVLHCAGKTHLSTMDTRGRHQRLFRRDFSSMALNPYSHGKSHAQEMAESRIYGKAGSPPNRRRDTTGWHHFTR